MKSLILHLITASAIISTCNTVCAEDVEFPDEELARETVLPKFDRVESVKNRNVVTDKRWEFGGFYGFNMTEPIYNQAKVGFNLGYHLTENSAVMINYSKWAGGKNKQYTDSLESSSAVSTGSPIDTGRAPALNYSLYANYELNAYYGKISLTKQAVTNMHLYPIIGMGMTSYSHKNYPGFNGGAGLKFYFGKSVALRSDFKLQYAQGPSPFIRGLKTSVQPPPTGSDFPDRWVLSTILDLGVSFLF